MKENKAKRQDAESKISAPQNNENGKQADEINNSSKINGQNTLNKNDDFPELVLKKWQDIADLLADIIKIPAVLIMKTENEFMEVLVSSRSENNPYRAGDKEKWYGLYCETVIKKQKELSVPNATKDKDWCKNPDIKLGMIAYLGFPVNYPDNKPFGTICVLDNKERAFTLLNKKLLMQFKDVIELDLALMQSFKINKSCMATAVAEEISERRKAEEALRASDMLLQSAINILPVGLWVIDSQGKIVMSSAAAQQIWAGVRYVGVDQLGEYKGWRTDTGKLIEAHEWAGARALEKGETTIEEEVEIECFDGTHKIILDTAMPLRNSDGSINGAITINQDITARKQAEVKLKEYSENLEEMVKARTDELMEAKARLITKERLAMLGHFAGSISHELRNPLGVIDSSTYFLRMKLSDNDEKVQEHLKRINDSVKISSNIIESLLNLTRQKPPVPAPENLITVIKESIVSIKLPQKIEVILDIPENDITVYAEAVQLMIVFKNLIKNAVDAMKQEGVLKIRVTKNQTCCIISFKDNGEGILPENIEKVFEPLFSTKINGIGFGLSMAKMIIENHKGTIRAESEYGKGAGFIIELPVAVEEKEEKK